MLKKTVIARPNSWPRCDQCKKRDGMVIRTRPMNPAGEFGKYGNWCLWCLEEFEHER